MGNIESNKDLADSEIMRQLLAELRYSALALANELGYKSHSTIHHILCDRNKISDDLIDKIIKRFPEVHYWFLKKGHLPVLLNEKLKQNQQNLFGKSVTVESPDYSLETFATLKNVEKLLMEMVSLMKQKSGY